jgi:hypothetical protein
MVVGALAASATVLRASGVAAATLGNWNATVTGTGAGTAKAKTMTFTVTADTNPTAQLFPGGTGDVTFNVKNNNGFPIAITDVVLSSGSSFTSSDSTCNSSASGAPVTFTPVHSASIAIPSDNTDHLVTLSSAAGMASAAGNTCQGKVFNASLDVTASQSLS